MPSSTAHIAPSRPYSSLIGSVLIVIGLLLGMAWAFRVWTILLLAQGDSSLISHSLVAVVSLGAAVMLFLTGLRTVRRRASSSDPSWMTGIGLWIAGVGVHRLVAVVTNPSTDPNPRAHLHLSVAFMVIGALLLGTAWFWKRADTVSSLQDRTPA
ncbi:MAG: hypothetical protein HY208_06925 [Nitrospirae bacterium]|nr:hypothetical protein [Nitrospirota bacterium]